MTHTIFSGFNLIIDINLITGEPLWQGHGIDSHQLLSFEKSSKIWQKKDCASWMLTVSLTDSVALNLAFILSGQQIPTCSSKNISVPSLSLFLSLSVSISISINVIRTSTKWVCNVVIIITSQNSKITSIYG